MAMYLTLYLVVILSRKLHNTDDTVKTKCGNPEVRETDAGVPKICSIIDDGQRPRQPRRQALCSLVALSPILFNLLGLEKG